jgi:hypothetical protein
MAKKENRHLNNEENMVNLKANGENEMQSMK